MGRKPAQQHREDPNEEAHRDELEGAVKVHQVAKADGRERVAHDVEALQHTNLDVGADHAEVRADERAKGVKGARDDAAVNVVQHVH